MLTCVHHFTRDRDNSYQINEVCFQTLRGNVCEYAHIYESYLTTSGMQVTSIYNAHLCFYRACIVFVNLPFLQVLDDNVAILIMDSVSLYYT